MSRVVTPIKWHGGKHYLASKIVALFPPKGSYLTYCEPYAGGLSVLLAADPEGVSEVANDLSLDLSLFWRVLQDEVKFARFLRLVQATPFSQKEWGRVANGLTPRPTVDSPRAAAFFVRCRQSLAGRMKSFAPVSVNRTRRGMNEQVSAWLAAIDGLPEVHARLKRVLILQDDAARVIEKMDSPNTLFYLDPPYLIERAENQASSGYELTMTPADHENLLRLVNTVRGKVILSGYRSGVYDKYLADWRRVQFRVCQHSAWGEVKNRVTETVWLNY